LIINKQLLGHKVNQLERHLVFNSKRLVSVPTATGLMFLE